MVKYVPDDLEQIFEVLLSQNEACIERTSIVMLPEIFVVPCIIELTTTGLETDHHVLVWPATTVPPSALGEEKEGRSSGTRD